jgi:hypothetical protein
MPIIIESDELPMPPQPQIGGSSQSQVFERFDGE